MKKYKKVANYNVIEKIGQGSFGTVYKGEKITDPDSFYAIKKVDKEVLKKQEKLSEYFQTEIKIMKYISHSNIIHCYDYQESGSSYWVVMDYCKDGDLAAFINSSEFGKIPETHAIFLLQQIMNGFKKLHENKVMHRDFKPANVFQHDGVVKIGDFGLAKIGKEKASTTLGTPECMAPEILFTENNTEYTNKTDLWSIGVTFFMMLFGTRGPFKGTNIEEYKTYMKKYSGKRLKIPVLPQISDDAKDLLINLMQFDPEKRISWKDFFNHPLFKYNKSKSTPQESIYKDVQSLFEINKYTF